MQWIDIAGMFLDLTTNRLWNKLLHQLFQIAARCLPRHDLEHLFANFTDLTRLGIGCFAHLVWTALCEGDGKEAEKIAIRGLDIDMCLDECLPFTNKRTEFVRGEVHAVEVGETVLALYLINPQLYFSEGLLFVLVEICEGDLDDTTL